MAVTSAAVKSSDVYFEDFDNGPGGWVANRYDPLPIWDGAAYCFGPWFLDSNHDCPIGGYLHLLMWLRTTAADHRDVSVNRFVAEHKSTNLTNAKLSVRLRGQMDFQGAQLLLWVQGRPTGHKVTSNYALRGQPFRVTNEWSEQTVHLAPDPAQWSCAGARWDLEDVYGCSDIASVLQDVNVDILFVLYPLKVVPASEVKDPHRLRPSAGPGVPPPGLNFPTSASYEIKREFLPKGIVMFDWVKIEYAE